MFDLWSSNEREYRHRMTNEPELGRMHALAKLNDLHFYGFWTKYRSSAKRECSMKRMQIRQIY